MIIKSKFKGTCKGCMKSISKGEQIIWSRVGGSYHIDCHDGLSAYEMGDRSPGAYMSHYDRTGIYSYNGVKMGSSCGCEDYPCCGH